ncbi:MAG: hypothetical protein ACXVJF_01080 [Acidimicrobiia bacterium]
MVGTEQGGTDAHRRRRRASTLGGLALAIVALLPPIVAFVPILGEHWYPVLDQATIDLRVRDVWTANMSLTGAFGRFDWNHPGPAMYFLVSPFSLLAGGTANATRVGFLVVQIVALAAALVLAWRYSRTLFLATATVAALSYLAVPVAVYRDPWNPWVPVPLLVLLLVLTCRASLGRPRDLVGIVVVGSVMVQSHAGTAPIVAGCAAYAVVLISVTARRRRRLPEHWRSTVAWAAGLAALLWLAPVIGVVTDAPGNLLTLVRFFVGGGHPTVGLTPALHVMAHEFAWRPPWLGATTRSASLLVQPAPARWLVVPAVLLAAGFLAVGRSRRRDDAVLVGLAAFLLVVAVVAISREDSTYTYTSPWRGVLAPFVAVTVAAAVTHALVRAAPTVPTRAVAVGAAVAVVLVAVAVRIPGMQAESPTAVYGADMRQITVMIHAQRGIAGRTVLVRMPGETWGTYILARGLVNELDRVGAEVRVGQRSWFGREVGERRVARPDQVDTIWYLVDGPACRAMVTARPGSRVLWTQEPLAIVAVPGARGAAALAAKPTPFASACPDTGKESLALIADSIGPPAAGPTPRAPGRP